MGIRVAAAASPPPARFGRLDDARRVRRRSSRSIALGFAPTQRRTHRHEAAIVHGDRPRRLRRGLRPPKSAQESAARAAVPMRGTSFVRPVARPPWEQRKFAPGPSVWRYRRHRRPADHPGRRQRDGPWVVPGARQAVLQLLRRFV